MPPYPDSQLYYPYRSMPDWLPWIFSQMSNRKMLDFKSCVHGLLCLRLVQWTMKQLFNLFSVPRHLATTMIIASGACDSYPLQRNGLTILRIMGSPDSRLVHDASLCFLCGWIQKPLLFKRMFLFPCSLFDIGPCVKCGMSGPRRLWQWQCRAPLAFLIAGTLCILELVMNLREQSREDS